MVKYKKKLANLYAAQARWDRFPEKAELTCPSGINQRMVAFA